MSRGNELARQERELDELERRALDAWAEDSDDDVIASIDPGFVDRVMLTDEAAAPILRAVELREAEESAPAPRRSSWTTAVAAGLVCAVGLGAYATFGSRDFGFASLASMGDGEEPLAEAASPQGYEDPDALGRPNLTVEGTPGAPIPDDLPQKIASYVADYGRDWGPAFEFHGAIVVSRGGETKYAQGFGYADPDNQIPNTPDTRFRLGLLTEQFTAVAVLQLRDAGILELDDPVSRFFPNYPHGREITVEQLLTHTSGIPNYTSQPYFGTWKDEAHTTDELIARFASQPLEFEPGEDFSPTNSGYYLLGAIVERVSGQAYGEYVQEHIFAPAGMTSSSFGDAYETGEQARGRVWNDEEMLDPPDPIHMSVFGGAGGLVSSPTDLVRWDRALESGTVLSKSSLDEMLSDNREGFGFGWAVSEGYGQTVVSFPGAIDGFNGSMIRFTEDDTLITVLCNTEVVPGSRVAQDVAMMVYGDAPPRRREQHEVQIAPSTYPRYIGTYTMSEATWAKYSAHVDADRFSLLRSVHVRQYGNRLYFDVPGHALTWMHPMGGSKFFFKDHSGTRVSFALGKLRRSESLTVHYKNAEFVLLRARR